MPRSLRRASVARLALLGAVLTATALACRPAAAGPDPAKGAKPRPANHLAHESSPYLLQHAHNPVDWYPWGPEPFARAKKEGKLVFLSIGYSSCHWCHVMERECFENEAVAKLLNDGFVCIKVDREERPDIDNVYMTALNVTGEHGGWPLSMFLTADGKPIFGGTYWPPDDQEIDGQKAMGFKSVLRRVRQLWTDRRKDLDDQADRIAARTELVLSGAARGKAVVDLDRSLVRGAVDGVREEFDKTYGGFGDADRGFRGTKFPVPSYLRLLQEEAGRAKAADVDDMLAVTLDHMARGGIYDQVGGGFHRYSTERTWTVPHFEKMLYDNAQLVEVYARAWETARRPLYRRVVRETLAFVRRELTTPEGAFYSALDADAAGEEGRYYVWTDAEIEAALPNKEDAALVRKVYGADGPPNFEDKAHILLLPEPLAERAKALKLTEEELAARLEPLRQKLLEARAKRPRPTRDTKVLTGWNGLMIAGYARAGQALGEPEYTQAAARAADFVLTRLRTRDGRLLRTYGAAPGEKPEARLLGYLDDYAYLVHGLLNLHDATGEARWLDEAKALTDVMVKYHADPDAGGFFYTANDHEKLFARAKDGSDTALPSGNSVAARNLVRLWRKTGDDRYRALAEKTLQAFAGPLKANPTGLTTMAEALALYLDGKK
jgi:uncharacterized protein YyaL (SSP411 family)